MCANNQSPYGTACTRKREGPGTPLETSKEEPLFYSGQSPHQLLPLLKTLHCQWHRIRGGKSVFTQVFRVEDPEAKVRETLKKQVTKDGNCPKKKTQPRAVR